MLKYKQSAEAADATFSGKNVSTPVKQYQQNLCSEQTSNFSCIYIYCKGREYNKLVCSSCKFSEDLSNHKYIEMGK